MTVLLATAGTETATNPLFFVAGGVGLIIVSTLGPLSRIYDRRQKLKEQARVAAEAAARQ